MNPPGPGASARLDFHCHSTHSDGALDPRALAAQLAADGVAFAALTDHDTVEGLAAFGQVASRHGLGHVSGVEITTQCSKGEAHLLGYGFDPAHPELQATLLSLRQTQPPSFHSVADTLRARTTAPADSAAPHGRIDLVAAIGLIHRAGGKAFLAHPWHVQDDREALGQLLVTLKAQGLDGIEAYYAPYTETQRQELIALAGELGLLVSGGSDAHERRGSNGRQLGIDMPVDLWKQFRDAVSGAGQADHARVPSARPRGRPGRAHFVLHIILPTILAMGLFIAALFAVFLPALERSLMDHKREMIRELTNSAYSILTSFEQDERTGLLTRAQAQQAAISRIRALRYGREGKDYFWLQDKQPRIIMHPYRPDLEGRDVSGFTDPRGAHIFVEFADLCRRRQEGYIDYVWQWKDDPGRLAPKQSYIKAFQPWGWIIGTGLYIEDVRQEISRLERKLLQTSVAIAVILALLLLYVMRQAVGLDRERHEAEGGLRESTERYRSLVEATTEGTLLVLDGRCSYANPILLRLIGCAEHELQLLDLEDLMPRADNEAAWERVEELGRGHEAEGAVEGMLRARDGRSIECLFAFSRIDFAGRTGFILLARPLGRRQSEREALVERLQASLLFLHEPVGHVQRKPVLCRADDTVHAVVGMMAAQEASAALVQDESGEVVGIFTDRDLRQRVVAGGHDLSQPVAHFMTSPVVTVHEDAPVYEALLTMEDRGLQHLAVTDEGGRISSVIRNSDLLQFHSYGPIVLAREIAHAPDAARVAASCRRAPELARALVNSHAEPERVMRMLTSACDAATERLIVLAQAGLGPPPCRFAFLGLGSHGRQELMLSSDQDNAIVFAPEAAAASQVRDYFTELGSQVCAGLETAGYPLCRGEVMARNPKWCQPLEAWQRYFTDWIMSAEPRQLLEFTIFFDFRAVYGAEDLVRDLRRHVHEVLSHRPEFFPHFAQNALLFRPPTGLFGRLLGGTGDHSLNLKDALIPIISFARLYALRHAIPEINTLDRLKALAKAGVIVESSYADIVSAYEFLVRLRLEHQTASLDTDQPPGNTIAPHQLGQLDTTLLRQAFSEITTLQGRIRYDFLGGR